MDKMNHKTRDELEHLASFTELNPNPVIEVDYSGKITFSNQAAGEVLEKLGLAGRDVIFFLPADLDVILNDLKEDHESSFYREVVIKDMIFEEAIVLRPPLKVARIYAHDVTRRKRAEEALRNSDKRLRLAQDAGNVGFWNWDLQTNKVFYSPEWKRQIGYEDSEIANDFSEWQSRVHPNDLDRSIKTVRAFIEKPWPDYHLEFRFRHKDGSYRWILAQASLIYDDQGKPTRMLGSHVDITESKRVEMEREHYFRFFQSSSDLMTIADPKGAFKKINPACSRILGYSEAELLAKPFVEFVHPDDRQRTIDEMARQLRLGFSINFENRYLCKDGSVRWLSWRANYDKDEGLTYATARDVTEKKQVEEALRLANAHNRNLIEVSLDPLVTIGKDGKITDVNAATEAVTGFTRSELIGTDFSSYCTEPEKARKGYEQVFRTGFVRDYPLDIEQRNGTVTSVLYNASVYRDDAGNVIGVFAAARDVTERKKIEDALQKSEAFIKNILETVDEEFIVVDKEYRILSANRAFHSSINLSAEQVLGRTCHEISHHQQKPCFETGEECPVKQVFETGAPSVASHTHLLYGGNKRHVEIKAFPVRDTSGNVVSAIETINDVTERKHLEEQLRHAQRLESLGTLAGGVAHDFNNILNVIVGYGGMIEMRMPKDDPNIPYIREILAAADRATHLTQALLIFSRKQVAEMKQVSINELIEGMRKMILRLIGEDIETHISPPSGQMTVMGDIGQLEQVLMNLATNARDAMPDGGSLSIKSQLYEMGSEFIEIYGYGKPGEYALISVSDTGGGMDEKTRQRIFEPFFTTKVVGKGTGLGLAIVYGIVKQHNGFINCYSEPGRGTTFKVYLPVVKEELTGVEEAGTGPLKGGNETILIADDDETIRKLTKELLEMHGYTVIEAQDGADAVNKFLDYKERINLVLLDVIMPKKSGRVAFEEIKGIKPDVKILFVSGYTEDIIQRKRIIEDRLPLLQKPTKPKELLAKIREIIDAKG